MIIDRDAVAASSPCSTCATTWPSTRGTFRVRGDTIEITPYEELAIRIEMFGDEIDSLAALHSSRGGRDRPG